MKQTIKTIASIITILMLTASIASAEQLKPSEEQLKLSEDKLNSKYKWIPIDIVWTCIIDGDTITCINDNPYKKPGNTVRKNKR